MSVLLSDLPITKLLGVLDLESSDSSYCDVRDRNRHGQQHIDCLAIIFSGALNDGKYYLDDDRNPFHMKPNDGENAGAKATPILTWKANWTDHFPTMSEMESSSLIPDYLFKRGFVKKSSRTPGSASASATSCSSSLSATSSVTTRDSIAPVPMSPFHLEYYEDSSVKVDSDIFDVDLTPEKSTSRFTTITADVTDNYVLDRITDDNRGFCSIIVTGSAPLEMEFNIDETCGSPRNFNSLPGTHRWMLYKDMKRGELTVTRGSLLSIVSINSETRVICCIESFTPSDVLFLEKAQLYKLNKDFFRMPAIMFASPISIDG